MHNPTLYNCCPNHEPPDWGVYDAIEVMGVSIEELPDGSTDCTTADHDYEADIYTVYGHLIGGGVEAITDCSTFKLADTIANMFSHQTGLPVYYT